MTVQTSARISTQIQVVATANIYKQIVILPAFPTNPIEQVLYIVGTVAKYWNGIAWITLAGGGGSVAWNDITGKPTFATVATSGSYNDLTNKPTVLTNTIETITIAVADWSLGTTCTKTVPGVTATSLNLFSIAESQRAKVIQFDVRPSAQGTNSITFTADATPDAEIVLTVVIQK